MPFAFLVILVLLVRRVLAAALRLGGTDHRARRENDIACTAEGRAREDVTRAGTTRSAPA